MNKIILLFLFFGNFIFAQVAFDKILFYDDSNNETTSENYKIKRIIKEYNLEKEFYEAFDYNSKGVLLSKFTCSNKYTFTKDGEHTFYYPNGTPKWIKHFHKSKPVGNFKEWYENGTKRLEAEYIDSPTSEERNYKILQLWDSDGKQQVVDGNGYINLEYKRNLMSGEIINGFKNGVWKETHMDGSTFSEIYSNGNFISGESIVNTEKVAYTELESKPQPKKGIKEFYNYIAKNFKNTSESIKNKITGQIFIKFIIDKDGKLIEPEIIKGLGYGLDEEALRVLLSYENWIPGKQRGKSVRVKYSIPITVHNN